MELECPIQSGAKLFYMIFKVILGSSQSPRHTVTKVFFVSMKSRTKLSGILRAFASDLKILNLFLVRPEGAIIWNQCGFAGVNRDAGRICFTVNNTCSLI